MKQVWKQLKKNHHKKKGELLRGIIQNGMKMLEVGDRLREVLQRLDPDYYGPLLTTDLFDLTDMYYNPKTIDEVPNKNLLGGSNKDCKNHLLELKMRYLDFIPRVKSMIVDEADKKILQDFYAARRQHEVFAEQTNADADKLNEEYERKKRELRN